MAEVIKKEKPGSTDFNKIADFVISEWSKRKSRRIILEKEWKEIDRQLRMEPDKSLKLDSQGRRDSKSAWIPELELPLQSQTLEVLTADARRMMFPDSGPWFVSHVNLTDDFLETTDLSALISGDKNEVPTSIDQDGADKLVTGVVNHWHRQYDFHSNVDAINAESFKYGMGVGRARLVKKSVFQDKSRGVTRQDQVLPVLIPRSIKETYLDDNPYSLMNEGHLIAPAVIFEKTQRIEDLILAAKDGSSDPKKDDGGWMRAQLKDLKGDDSGNVQLLEYEGGLLVPISSTETLHYPNAIVTVVVGVKDKSTVSRVVRFRQKDASESTYIEFPYHSEHVDTPYAASPLMKGRPIQIAATDALTRLLMAGAYDAQPALRYSPDDPRLAANGGPILYPGACIPSADPIEKIDIGNPTALLQVYVGLLQQYFDVTGVNAPRLGAQTKSHTTAFAKDAEITQGTVRTVDYVRSSLKGGLTRWLDLAYKMGSKHLGQSEIYIDAYNGFVDIDKSKLPETVVFEAHGSGGPAEEQAKRDQRLNSMQLALQVDNIALQTGREASLDLNKVVDQILREGGWTDVDTLLRSEGAINQAEQGSNLSQSPGLVTADPTQV